MEIEVNKTVKGLLSIGRTVHQLPLKEINTKFYVRVELDEDRVAMFREMIESGRELPPILVTEESHTLIDGRTRLAASERTSRETVPCVFCSEADEQTLIAAAYLANADPTASKPPTRSDIRHTMEIMLRAGTSKNEIRQCFEHSLGKSMFRRYLDDAESKLNKQKLSSAREAVADGKMSVNEAAKHFGVDITSLKKAIKGKKKSKDDEEKDVGAVKSAFSSASRKFSSVLSQHFSHKLQEFERGELTKEEMAELLAHERRLLNSIAHAHEDRQKRFQALQ